MDKISEQLDVLIAEVQRLGRQTDRVREIFNISQASEYLAVSENTLREWVRKRTIPFSKINGSIRFKKSKLDRWLDRCEVPMQ